jgi:hypothetical protein
MTLRVKVLLRPKDPNPWKGKSKIPRVLVGMLLRGVGVAKMTAKERTALMLPEAVRTASDGAKTIETGLVTVNWSKPLADYDMKACHQLLIDAKYRPSSQDNTLSRIVKLIQAGKPKERPRDDVSATWGIGHHAVTFFNSRDMLYRGERYRVTWRTKGNAGLMGASGEVFKGRQSFGGLWKFLGESVGREDFDAIRQTASNSDSLIVAKRLVIEQKADTAALEAKLEAEIGDVMFHPGIEPDDEYRGDGESYSGYADNGEGQE